MSPFSLPVAGAQLLSALRNAAAAIGRAESREPLLGGNATHRGRWGFAYQYESTETDPNANCRQSEAQYIDITLTWSVEFL